MEQLASTSMWTEDRVSALRSLWPEPGSLDAMLSDLNALPGDRIASSRDLRVYAMGTLMLPPRQGEFALKDGMPWQVTNVPPRSAPFSMSAMKSNKEPPMTSTQPHVAIPAAAKAMQPVERNMRGLVDALFDELDEIRAGRGSEAKVKQITQVSVRITELMGVEMKYRKMALEAEGVERKRLMEISGAVEIEG